MGKVESVKICCLTPVSADEVVLVSPIEVARFLKEHFDPEQFGCDWAHFLELFPNRPRNLVQLSWELYQLFRRFLDRPIDGLDF